MSMVSEDLLDLDWKDYEGIIGHDPITNKYQLQLNHHIHWFDTREEAEHYLKMNKERVKIFIWETLTLRR